MFLTVPRKASCRLLRLLPLLFCVLSAPAQNILREYWLGVRGNTIADLTNSPDYPGSPTGREAPTIFEGPTNWSDNYGSRFRGYVTPTTNGNHTFFIAGDNQCELWLSTDENPANKRRIARVLTWTGPRVWQEARDGNAAAQRSAAIQLVAGQKYYIEALQKDDTGNDCLAVGWQLPSGTLERPIPGSRLSAFQLSTNAPVILQEPADRIVIEGNEERFTVVADGLQPMEYLWQKDGQDLLVERSATLILTYPRTTDSGAKYRCVITNPKGQVTTREAVLTVFAEGKPPTLAVVAPLQGMTVREFGQVEITFSEPVSGVEASDLTINGIGATNVTGTAGGPYLFTFPAVSGTASVAFSANHGIKDLSDNQNPFGGGSWTINVNPNLAAPKIRINEIVASNETGLLDDDLEPQDWIELQNFGTTTVNLAGWSISDDRENPGQWIFPSVSIAAGQRLVIFASGKDRAVTTVKPLHTNFLLGEDGEFLGLYDGASPRNLISSLDPFPEQRVNHSYGLDANGDWKYYSKPSPGVTNGVSSILGILPAPHFSSERGFFASAFEIHLTTDVPGAEIRYTRNGGDPSGAAGILYTNPITISAITVLRASVWKTNYLPSFPKTHTYLYNIIAARRSLPALSIVTATNNLLGTNGIIGINGNTYVNEVWQKQNASEYHNPSQHGIAWERPTSVEFFYPTNDAQFQADCGIRVQGSDYIRPRYRPTSKFSYRLYFRGDYGPGQLRFPLFPNGAPFYDQIVLRAGHNDDTNPFIKDELMRRLFLETGQVGSRGNFATLYLNGSYKGYYNITERIEEHFLRAWHGGDEEWDVMEQGNVALDGDNANFNAMVNFFRNHSMTNSANYIEGSRRLDYTNFIDYLLANIYGANGDWPHNNWRAARERTENGIWRFYMWDAEFALGTYGRPVTWDTFANELTRTEEIPTLYTRLRASPEFRLLFADRINKHFYNGGGLVDTNITRHYNALRNEMSQIISGFDTFIQTSWIPQRRQIITNHFNIYGLAGAPRAPVFSQHGGRVAAGYSLSITSAAPAGSKIYYTTNGSDPRVMFTSALALSAKLYTAGQPIVLSENTRVKARVLNTNNTWTALTEALFEVSEFGAPIRFTEINYNPSGGEAFEFLELKNFSATTIDLSGMSFDGVSYRFPENSFLPQGGFVLLASKVNPTAFATRYPNADVSGYFENSLNNSGERISLLDRAGNIVAWVDYRDNAGWPTDADGLGYTLELANREVDPNSAVAWRRSSALYGSPGEYFPAAPPAGVIINEILTASGAPGWVELYNPTVSEISISNFLLGDTVSPRRFVVPNNTMLGAGEYFVANLNVSAAGGTLFLYNANTNRLDAIHFGRQLTNTTLARIDGVWTLGTPTPSAANSAASLAPAASFVMNEWLANPVPGADDWIELYNNSDLPGSIQGLTLSVSNSPYRIPTLTFVPPRGYIQLFASEKSLPNHLALKLPAVGAPLRLYDPNGAVLSSLTYSSQIEGVSEGRIPDGSATFTKFRGSVSPGAANYVINISSPLLINEVMVRNSRSVLDPFGGTADWIELFNSGPAISLDGLSLSDNRDEPAQWNFPPGLTLESQRYLVIWFDPTQPATTNAPFNTSRALSAEGGGVYLFNAQGQVLDQFEYGPLPADLTMGRAGSWALTAAPTPGATNAGTATLAVSASVRINEWFTGSATEPAWIELHNSAMQPVYIGGMSLTDDLSLLGTKKYVFPQLSYLGPNEFLRLKATGDSAPGELNFNLSDFGEAIRLYTPAVTTIDTVAYGVSPIPSSLARIPNATGSARASFPTPGESNYIPLNELEITRIFPAQNLVEVRNLSDGPVDLTGWLSASPTIIPARAFVNFSTDLSEDRDFGGQFVLARTSTNQARIAFGPGDGNVSYRAVRTSMGVQSIVCPREPVVINEVMYHTTDNSADGEYVEIRNSSDTAVAMSNWRINGGINFKFAANFSLAANGVLLIVPFDPENSTARAAFKARYIVPDDAVFLGPFRGRLANDSDTIRLERPLPAQAGYIPHVVVDEITYTHQIPWPVTADGGGAALHRIRAADLGNEPLNWVAGPPTPGRAEEIRDPSDRDADGVSDVWEIANRLDLYNASDAEIDSDGDGVNNRREYNLQTDPSDPTDIRRVTIRQSSLEFPVLAGQTVRVEYRESFGEGDWQLETTLPAGEDRVATIPIANNSAQRFYRLVR